MKYEPTIGLEIHTELKTKTKMFCNSLNDPNEKHPNINVCPVCMGHPGTLPVINKEAVRKVLLVGKALGGKLADYSQFDRKNYFYPDLPKGYQISQYKYPLVEGGELNGIKIIRIHLEEDAGRLIHVAGSSLVDFNRAGVPLMELVTEPMIKNGEEAKKFAQELQLIMRYLDVSDADMEKGQMRIEVNISLSNASRIELKRVIEIDPIFEKNSCSLEEENSRNLGSKVEIKNLNSFRAVERAIDYEIKRQREILKKGGRIKQETRGWSEIKGETFSQREKEESHDYRYFPEPDLPAFKVSDLGFELIVPELPQEKYKRFKKEFNIREEQIKILVQDKKLADYFEEVASELKDKDKIQLAANYLLSDVIGLMNEKMLSIGELLMSPKSFADTIVLVSEEKITARTTKNLLKMMIEKGGEPFVIIQEQGLTQISDETAISDLAERIIKENGMVVNDYKKGKEAALQFLVGQGMKLSRGSVNPEILREVLVDKILKI